MNKDLLLLLLLTFVCLMLILVHINDVENFAASQGGALIQLMSSHVASEEEMAQMREINKRMVVRDIINMTEPESLPGPLPAYR
jgi:predicted membrane protein